MRLETVRAVADWLGDGTYGLAAKLAALSFDGSDTAPSGTWNIVDETRSDDAATDRPPTAPFVRVVAGDARSLNGEAAQYTHTAEIPLEITIQRSATSPSALVRDLYYCERALIQSVEALFGNSAAAETARFRGDVQLQVITQMSLARSAPAIEDHLGSTALYVTVQARDTTT